MPLNRREFLTLMGGSAGAAVLFQACGLPERELLIDSPIEMPEDMVTGIDNWYATVSHQWPASEGIVVRVMEGRAKKVEGNLLAWTPWVPARRNNVMQTVRIKAVANRSSIATLPFE